ncbi:MAG: bifunctional 4-hydroxy-2-oxoglutarate aldolase/2-dehydro-3-deoxy-phosphogluconate aldolase [bacterium]|nr:bifunctional 4-hydroxy-2-oxoglutarate aldolase/2-dehydro-3-deoxy-phosphogluconate aldolase [bacterium]
MDLAKFKQQPIMGIMRDVSMDIIDPLLETVIDSGLKTIEITMNTKNAEQLIRYAVKKAVSRLTIGAGTVLDLPTLQTALQAGATFIVMPTLVPEVVHYCVANKIPVFPGALTPQEIFNAWRSGATMVKVFPAKTFGPEYFKELKGPFKNIELLACGGVSPANLRIYISNGASAVSFGASVFRQDWLDNREFPSINRRISQYLAALINE